MSTLTDMRFTRMLLLLWTLLLPLVWCQDSLQSDQNALEYFPVLSDKLGWNQMFTSPCDGGWFGITCNANKTRVIAIEAKALDIQAVLPQGFDQFSALVILDLSVNFLNGSLPLQLANLTLHKLDLSHNQLTGGIPPAYERLSPFCSVDLSNNLLTGEIPRIFPVRSNLACNFFSGQHTLLEGELCTSCPSGSEAAPAPSNQCVRDTLHSLQTDQKTLALLIGPSTASTPTPTTWADQMKWPVTSSPCSSEDGWTGVTCEKTFFGELRVTGLDLERHDLSGGLPLHMEQLSVLRYLDLDHNQMHGEISDSLASLVHLKSLDLSHNLFSGVLPSFLSQNKTSLSSLNLNNNLFTGLVPLGLPSFANIECNFLRTNVSDSGIIELLQKNAPCIVCPPGSISSGIDNQCIPDQRTLADDTALLLSWPIAMHMGWTNASAGLVCNGGWMGVLCDSFMTANGGKMDRIVELRCDDMYLEGPLFNISGLTELRVLDASHNRFTGVVPADWGSAASLVSVDVSFNELRGEIPSNLLRLGGLRSLILNNNRLTGSVGDFTLPMPGAVFEVKCNLLSPSNSPLLEGPRCLPCPQGFLPLQGTNQCTGDAYNYISDIIVLAGLNFTYQAGWNVSGEVLMGEGAICGEEGEKAGTTWRGVSCRGDGSRVTGITLVGPRLPEIGTKYEALTGTLPTDMLERLTALDVLDLSGNLLHGPIPEEMAFLSHMHTLDLGYNRLTGPVLPHLALLPALTMLWLNNNFLIGFVPFGLPPLTDLSCNFLNETNALDDLPPDPLLFFGGKPCADCPAGSLPSMASNQCRKTEQPTLSSDVAYLLLLDPLAKQMGWNMTFLTQPNPDTGERAPHPCLGALAEAVTCNADHSRITGLEVMDRGIIGPLSNWIGKLSGLGLLDLHDNQLTGPLPADIVELEHLLLLDLSTNLFTGNIPEQYARLPRLTVLHLQNNRLEGTVPPGLPTSDLRLECNFLRGGSPLLKGNPCPVCPVNFHPSKHGTTQCYLVGQEEQEAGVVSFTSKPAHTHGMTPVGFFLLTSTLFLLGCSMLVFARIYWKRVKQDLMMHQVKHHHFQMEDVQLQEFVRHGKHHRDPSSIALDDDVVGPGTNLQLDNQ